MALRNRSVEAIKREEGRKKEKGGRKKEKKEKNYHFLLWEKKEFSLQLLAYKNAGGLVLVFDPRVYFVNTRYLNHFERHGLGHRT